MADVDTVKDRIIGQLKEWLTERLERKSKPADPAKKNKASNTKKPGAEPVETQTAVSVGLILCQKLKNKYPLEQSDMDTGGGQVPGLSAKNVHAIIKRHGITRRYAEEAGRTTRSSANKAKALMARIDADPDFKNLSEVERRQIVEAMEANLIQRVQAFFARKKLEVAINLSKPGPVIVADIMAAAYEKKLGGPVAQHLVGAKLARKFPNKTIDNFRYTAADAQLGRDGDFTVENTAFHVTVAPTLSHLNKCGENIKQGRKPYLIVPSDQVSKARAYAEAEKVEDKTAITSIEQFIGQNVDEMGEFAQGKTKTQIAAMLAEYNSRVAEVENDQSIQIVIPKNVAEE